MPVFACDPGCRWHISAQTYQNTCDGGSIITLLTTCMCMLGHLSARADHQVPHSGRRGPRHAHSRGGHQPRRGQRRRRGGLPVARGGRGAGPAPAGAPNLSTVVYATCRAGWPRCRACARWCALAHVYSCVCYLSRAVAAVPGLRLLVRPTRLQICMTCMWRSNTWEIIHWKMASPALRTSARWSAQHVYWWG